MTTIQKRDPLKWYALAVFVAIWAVAAFIAFMEFVPFGPVHAVVILVGGALFWGGLLVCMIALSFYFLRSLFCD